MLALTENAKENVISRSSQTGPEVFSAILDLCAIEGHLFDLGAIQNFCFFYIYIFTRFCEKSLVCSLPKGTSAKIAVDFAAAMTEL